MGSAAHNAPEGMQNTFRHDIKWRSNLPGSAVRQELDKVTNLDQAREFFRARGFYAGNRNLFSDRDLYVGILHEGDDFDTVEDAFYLYMEDGAWVTRVTPPGGEPVITPHGSFAEVWEARYPDEASAESPEPPEPETDAVSEAAATAEQQSDPAPEPNEATDAESGPVSENDSTAVPEGFEPLFRSSPFLELLGPLYNKQTDKALVIGFFAAEKHCNARGVVHGGVLSSLADVALGYSAVLSQDDPKPLVTANLSVDYAGAAKQGDWIEIETDVQKVGRKMAFANGYFRVGSRRIARASAVFSVVND